MRDLITITKLLFKSNYSLDFKSKQGRKGILLVGLVVLCLIPCLIVVYTMFETGFRVPLIEHLMMQMGFGAACFILIWTALFLFPTIFYFSNDLEHLLVYPIKPSVIVSAKFLVVYSTLFFVSLMLLVPMLAAYLMTGHTDIISILFFIFFIILIPLVPTLIVSVFWMVLIKFVPFFQNKDKFNMLTGLLSIVMGIGVGIASGTLSSSMATNDPMELIMTIQNNPETFNFLSKIFFHIPFATRTIIDHSFIDLGISLFMILVSGALFYACADKLYLSTALNIRSSSSKKKRKSKTSKETNPIWSYWKVDFYKLVRTPAYFTNCVLSCFMMPIIMFVMFIVTPNMKELPTILKGFDFSIIPNLSIYFLTAGMAVGFFFGSLNGISGTAFSREGSGIEFMSYIPMSFKVQMWIKLSIGFFFSLLTCILTILPVLVFIKFPISAIAMYIIGNIITCALVNIISFIIDGIHPKLDWEDENSAVKNNMNVFLEFIISWAILAVVMVPLFMFSLLEHIAVYMTIVFIILTIVTILLCILGPKWIQNHLQS